MNIKLPPTGHENLHKGRVSIPSQIYFITVVCKNREKRFKGFYMTAKISRVLAQQATWSDALVMAWVLMPDHYHVLIQLGEKTSLQNVIKRANSVLAITVNKESYRSGQV